MDKNDDKNNDTEKEQDFCSKYYPYRRSGKADPDWYEKLFKESKKSHYYQVVCECNVMEAFKKNPIIKILVGALKNAGCPVDLKRHIVCEECSNKMQGGFDSEFNQIVICRNVTQAREKPEIILTHELIHMYDYCVNEVDFSNLEHLACTEIRAANLAHCSFLSSLFLGESSPINIKKTHQDNGYLILVEREKKKPKKILTVILRYCVKMKATQSLSIARNLNFPTAAKYVLKVFEKCYNDLEPIGRRIRRNSSEPAMAHEEAVHFGICDP